MSNPTTDRLKAEYREQVDAATDHYFDEVGRSISGTILLKLPTAHTLELDEVGGLYWAPGRIFDKDRTLLWDAARDTIRLFNDLYEAVSAVDSTKLSETIALR